MTKLVRRTTLVGLGAALILAGSAHAQQSVDPSLFLDPDSVASGVARDIKQSVEPGVVESGIMESGITEPVVEQDSEQGIEPIVEQAIEPIDALRIAQDTSSMMRFGIEREIVTALRGQPSIARGEEAELKELKTVDSLLVMILLGGTGAIVWYATTITRRTAS